ncbi:unnamed protein product [Porites evermanni]|uniref:Autophagy protein 5 n=1 Tax=Porites evermanni TaxID=104178 RepID=A0ABN8RKZ3_9CNID|nr:unnamed protein product [Porites evermanni]
MAEDREVLRYIWDGRLPVCFNLSSDEVVQVEQPDPYYLLVPRLSYLTLVTDKVQRHFQRAISSESVDEMWFEYDGQPLKCKEKNLAANLGRIHGSCSEKPILQRLHGWKDFALIYKTRQCRPRMLSHVISIPFIVLHSTHTALQLPQSPLLPCRRNISFLANSVTSFLSFVLLLQADNLKHRSQVINSMQKKDHKQLWLGLSNDKFEQFWAVNRRLMERTGDDPYFKFIPFRILQSDSPFIQQLFRPVTESGELRTLGDLLHEFVPEAFTSGSGAIDNEWRVVIHGIEPPLETPAQWISEHFSHPDNFLYIVLVRVV